MSLKDVSDFSGGHLFLPGNYLPASLPALVEAFSECLITEDLIFNSVAVEYGSLPNPARIYTNS
jgi:hypothetical protein